MARVDFEPHVWSVGALCLAISDTLNASFNPVAVKGEISGFSRAASGHCYFNLKEYEQAERSLSICLGSKYSNFYEEAEWYVAKGLLAQGKKDKGAELLRAIVSAGGFYAKQAEAEIKRLSANY